MRVKILSVCFLIMFMSTGCYQKAGVVLMDRAMTVDQLYEQRDKYIGQVVTVVWDTIRTRSSGFNRFPAEDSLNGGHVYDLDIFTPNLLKKLNITQEQLNDSIKKHILEYKGMDCPDKDFGTREIGIIRDFEKDAIVAFPKWISDTIKNKYNVLQIKRSPEYVKIWDRLGYSKKSWVTGVLVGFYQCKQTWDNTFEEDPESNCATVWYVANIIPIGIQITSK